MDCALKAKARPSHSLTRDQQKKALALAGTLYREEIAKSIGCSKSTFTRFAAEHRHINWNAHRYPDETIKKVCEYYLTHSLSETQKKFPGVTARSIIDRYFHAVKSRKWTQEEILKLYKYTGLVSWAEIAFSLNRSITSPKTQRRRKISGRVNGLSFDVAKRFLKNGCPFFYVRLNDKRHGQWVSPWVSLEKYLKESNPEWVNNAFGALARFQRWLHGSEERVFEIIEGKL